MTENNLTKSGPAQNAPKKDAPEKSGLKESVLVQEPAKASPEELEAAPGDSKKASPAAFEDGEPRSAPPRWPTPDQVDVAAVQTASLAILEEVGFKLTDLEGIDLFRKAGAEIEGSLVRPSRKLVQWLLNLAPSSFVLRAPNPGKSAILGGGAALHAAGYGCAAVAEPGKPWRPSVLADYARFAKIVQATDLLSLCGGILAQPGDVPAPLAGVSMAYASILSSDKPLMLTPADPGGFEDLLKLASIPWDGLEEMSKAPSTITLISASSPLTITAPSARTLILNARAGQASIIAPGPMAGSTGPATLAGNMVLANAECLAAICLAQLARPGAPVVYGVTATTADLGDGAVSIGGPEYALQAGFASELAALNGLPCRGGGAVTDAVSISSQSGWESAFQLMASEASGIDLIVHSAGILGAFGAMSFEKLICDLELIAAVKRFHEGIKVNEEAMALDAIRGVGPGGSFLNHRHTLANARTKPWHPRVARRGRVPEGESLEDAILKSARTQEIKLLEKYEPPKVKNAGKLDKLMLKLGADPKLLDSVKAALGR